MPTKCSLLFDVTTSPKNRTVSSAHSGGWSESHWDSSSSVPLAAITALAQRRAQILSPLASVIGYRTEVFTISSNKLLPGGTSSGRFQYPGTGGSGLNVPQDALQISLPAVAATNVSRSSLRGMADDVIDQGEYTPTVAFANAMQAFLNELFNSNWGFIGRVKSNPVARVQKITDLGVVTLSANIGGAANTDYLRLNRVYDNQGFPVKGSFLITNIAGNVYTLAGYTGQVVDAPSGTARIDAVNWFGYGHGSVSRAVSRKVGRPFEQYRGRRSKSRV